MRGGTLSLLCNLRDDVLSLHVSGKLYHGFVLSPKVIQCDTSTNQYVLQVGSYIIMLIQNRFDTKPLLSINYQADSRFTISKFVRIPHIGRNTHLFHFGLNL